MAQGRQQSDWAHTSMICALIANALKDPKSGKTYQPRDFDPTYTPEPKTTTQQPDDLTSLRHALETNRTTLS